MGIEQPQHTKVEEEAYERAKRADCDSASSEELEAAADKLAEIESQAEIKGAPPRIAVVKTDVRDCNILGVLIFRDPAEMATHIFREYNLTVRERQEIEDKGYALILPIDEEKYRLIDDGEVMSADEYPRGVVEFKSVAILNE